MRVPSYAGWLPGPPRPSPGTPTPPVEAQAMACAHLMLIPMSPTESSSGPGIHSSMNGPTHLPNPPFQLRAPGGAVCPAVLATDTSVSPQLPSREKTSGPEHLWPSQDPLALTAGLREGSVCTRVSAGDINPPLKPMAPWGLRRARWGSRPLGFGWQSPPQRQRHVPPKSLSRLPPEYRPRLWLRAGDASVCCRRPRVQDFRVRQVRV